ncbi:DUF5362 family protein [Gilliamella sp. wkB112]|uniref:DUF5362 family protein n=1 Tax=Gilliamella sp. wkB112 TaxID=3120257 RepID=UPI00080E8B74|nr:DUF5362 family protein [Gilliamella apicola]OCG03028.1 hypothetical protein A9G12_08905 [Gilliamella apicola]
MDFNQNNFDHNNTISIELSELLQKRMRFIAIMQQIYGVLFVIGGGISCIGIITAIVGIPMIIAGIKLFQSGSAFSLTANAKRGEDLVNAITQLSSYWKFTLIGFIALIVTYLLVIILFVSFLPSFYYRGY